MEQDQVLHLGVIVGGVGQDARHAPGQAHHPPEHINVMHRVVERAAATLLLPGAAPPQIVVAMAAPPVGVDLRVAHLARQAAVQQGLQVADGLAEAVLGDDGKERAALVPGAKHRVALLEGGGHGLLAHDVLAAAHRVDADLRVHVGRGAHVHQVDIRAGKQLLMVVVHVAVKVILLLHPLRLFRQDIHQRDDFAPLREGQISPDMGMGDIACADNCNA